MKTKHILPSIALLTLAAFPLRAGDGHDHAAHTDKHGVPAKADVKIPETSPVEKVSGGGGKIACAHVRASGGKVYVSGLVKRQSAASPPPWAHVDVIVLGRNRQVVEGIAVNYMPGDIPHGLHGQFPQSHYTARLTAPPAAGSTIKVVIHSAHKSKCEFHVRS
jgi:hypothetical protein